MKWIRLPLESEAVETKASAALQAPQPVAVISPSPRLVFRLHLAAILFLVAASIITSVLMVSAGLPEVQFFLLDREANLPTFFSMLMILEAVLLLTAVAASAFRQGDRFRIYWAVLAVLFACMAVDEAAQLHEKMMDPLRNLMGLSGLLYAAWVIPGFAFVLVAGLYFSRFLLGIERRLARLFMVSGGVYLSGVLGVEMFSGYFKEAGGFDSVAFMASTTLEETLEMLGLALFLYGLCVTLKMRGLSLGVMQRMTPAAAGPRHVTKIRGGRRSTG